MFSDNKNLIGDNPLYENLVKSMEKFDYHSNKSCRAGFVNMSNMDKLRMIVDSDISDTANFKKLYNIMNMKTIGKPLDTFTVDKLFDCEENDFVYMRDLDAIDRHKCMMFNNVFTKKQWNKAFSVTDVFDFNSEFYFKRDFIYMHAAHYLNCYGSLIVQEFLSGHLSCDSLECMKTSEWEGFMNSCKTGNPDLYDNKKLPMYFDTVLFIGDEILKFRDNWKDSVKTFVIRMIEFVRTCSDNIDNPYYKQDYVF